jgi:hypothetical protein
VLVTGTAVLAAGMGVAAVVGSDPTPAENQG